MPTLARITIYPFKSLDGQVVERARILSSGALAHDRRWALVDDAGRFLNGKRTAAIHAIRSAVDFERRRLELAAGHEVATFDLSEDREELERWFTLMLQERVRLEENVTHGFPDDNAAPGPTIISTATLETVATWFPGLTLDDVRRRFRANLEIGGVEPFWEDRLYGAAGEEVAFRIGEIELAGVNPCQRCVVPTRNPDTGEVISQFAKRFAQEREATLPPWADASRFDHFYRLAVNTRLLRLTAGAAIRVGDSISLNSSK